VKTTAFVDNTCTLEGQYFYKIKAVDNSLNSSAFTEEVSTTTTGEHELVAHYKFNQNTLDSSINLNHGATHGEIEFVKGKVDFQAISLNGTDAFIQLPATVANQKAITVATWIYWNGGTPWQRIFEFGNNDSEYMNLTPRLRFSIKNGGTEQRLNASSLPEGEWAHVAVILGESGARMYLNGELADESMEVSLRPEDFKPVLNYIGRGFSEAPLFDGFIDDFRIYNYELPTEEIAKLVSNVNTSVHNLAEGSQSSFNLYPVPANDVLIYSFETRNEQNKAIITIYNVYGKMVFQDNIRNTVVSEINVSDLSPGIYTVVVTNEKEILTRKIVIQH
jgi:hypothetical protein